MQPLSPITCRLFVLSDMPALYAVEQVCFAPPLRFSRGLLRRLVEDPICRTWVGLVGGVAAGFATVSLRRERDSDAAYIWTIEVLPAFRRRGVARELLARLEESARGAGCTAIDLHVAERNLEALALYESSGFTLAGMDRGFYGLGQDAFRYRKEL